MPDEKSSRELPKWQRDKNKFFPQYVEINVDGMSETWEFEESKFAESSVWIRYKLKGKETYKM